MQDSHKISPEYERRLSNHATFHTLCTSLWCQILNWSRYSRKKKGERNYDQWLSERSEEGQDTESCVKNLEERTFHSVATNLELFSTDNVSTYLTREGLGEGGPRWTAGAIYLFYLGWFWTGIGDLDGLVGRQPPGVPLDVDAGVHSGLLLRLPCPSSFLTASSLRKHFPEVPRVTPGPLLGPRSHTSNPQFLTWNEINEIGWICSAGAFISELRWVTCVRSWLIGAGF